MRRLALSAAALVLGLVVLVLGVMAPPPPRVNIRWTPETTDAARATLERDLRLSAPVFRGSRTWSYQLLDTSPEHVRRVLADPAVEDRHYFGPGGTLAPEAPPLQAWLQAHYGRPPVSWIAATWMVAAPLLLLTAAVVAWPSVRARARRIDGRIAALLVVAVALRVVLVAVGGQYYWPDEKRYRGAQRLVAALFDGNLAVARDEAVASPAALVQRITGIIPASIERLVGDTPWIPALFFAGASVISIWLTGVIARRLGGSRDAVFIAVLLMVASTTMLYYSRHLLTYDLALAAGLMALASAVERPGGVWRSLNAGLWAVVGFLAYPGSWPLTLTVGVVHLADAEGLAAAVRRGAVLTCGAAAAIGVLTVVYQLVGLSFINLMTQYAGLINQGEFAEGWRLPLAYLWSAEHGLLVVWGVALAWCSWRWRETLHDRLLRAGVLGAVVLYLLLAITSTGLHRFVMYGRLARPLVPFLCLAAAGLAGAWLQARPASERVRRAQLAAVAALVLLQGMVNAWQPLHQEFPSEFEARVARRYPGPLVLMNVRHLYPGPEPVTVPQGFHEVAAATHPLTFTPYLYEGYTPEERQVLRTSDIRMRIFAEAAAP